jgi:hypothetical protein
MHELALALGGTVEELEDRMSGVEYGLWVRYAEQRILPWRRMEFYLAQLARLIAATMGGQTDATTRDFLFDRAEDEPEDDDDEEDAAAKFFGFAPRKRQQE